MKGGTHKKLSYKEVVILTLYTFVQCRLFAINTCGFFNVQARIEVVI